MTQAPSVGFNRPALGIRYAEESNIGLRKKEQQDYQGHLYIPIEDYPQGPICVFIVCDGVSMGSAGALASQRAVEVCVQSYPTYLAQGFEPVLAFRAALQEANAEVVHLAQERPGMATTCVAVMLIGNQAVVAHVGDSRAYLSRPRQELNLLTIDHSWTEEVGRTLVRQGFMSDDDLRKDNRRHAITNALGLTSELVYDFNHFILQPGDRLLLCSDGLWDAVAPEMLEKLVMQEQGNPNEAILAQVAHNLINAAIAAGGKDNITVSLLEIDEIGPNFKLLALEKLIEDTRRSTQSRTGQNIQDDDLEDDDKPTIKMPIPTGAASIWTQPKPVRNLSTALQVVKKENQTPKEEILNKEANPTKPSEQGNPEVLFQKAQKAYALGKFEEALQQLIPLEQNNPDRSGLFEMMRNSLVRVITNLVTLGDSEQVLDIFEQLEQSNIVRYREMLFDFCREESQDAEQARNYTIVRDYARLALALRSTDSRSRQLADLSEDYIAFQNPGLSLEDRLNRGQHLYARDPDFGGIREDLAALYLELGDEAAKDDDTEDALTWYQMVRNLKPKDSRLYSLAIGKQRALELEMERRQVVEQQEREYQMDFGMATVPSNNGAPTINSANVGSNPTTEEAKPNPENLARLRERVSRAQKAWDGGRREVGGEYIYLVEQLGLILSPNPWQPTYPRVCYDYGKWLFDQHQYNEARPYFEKAQALGLGAAQQKLREIERIEKLEGEDYGFYEPVVTTVQADTNTALNNRVETDYSYDRIASAESAMREQSNYAPTQRQPLISTSVEVPPDARYVGSSHAGDGVLTPQRSLDAGKLRTTNSEPLANIEEPPARINTNSSADSGNSPDEAKLSLPHRVEKYLKPERAVGATGLRTPVNASSNKAIQQAVAREITRLNISGVPQAVAPKRATDRRAQATVDLIKGFWLPAVLAIIAIVAVVAVILNFTQSKATPAQPTPIVVAVEPSPTPVVTAAPTPTVYITAQPQVEIQLVSADASLFNVYVLPQNDQVISDAVQLEAEPSGVFNLNSDNASKINPNKPYTIFAQPKNSDTHKYLPNLLPTDAAEAVFTVQKQAAFGTDGFLRATLDINPNSLNFYPLDGGSQDADANGGGRYYSATHHIIRPDFLIYYSTNGSVARWGYPISEEFNLDKVGLVQFFERGWLVRHADGTIVSGAVGTSLLSGKCDLGALQPPSSTGSTFEVSDSFSSYVQKNKWLGKAISPFFISQANGSKKLVQYFEYGRLELDQTNSDASIQLGLVGHDYAACQSWVK